MSSLAFNYSDKVAGPAGLKALIQTGPYAATFTTNGWITGANWPAVANMLNDKNGTAGGQVAHADVQGNILNAATNWGEVLASVNSLTIQVWQGMLNQNPVKIGQSGVQNFVNSAFPLASCPLTRAAIQAYFTQLGSLIEVECGTGVATSNIDVQFAMTGSGPGNSWGL